MKITDKFKMTFDFAPFVIQFDTVNDSKIGNVDTHVLNFISKEVSAIIYKSIHLAGRIGFNLQLIFDILHLKFINAHDTQIELKDGYFKLCSNPWFDFKQ